MQHLTSHTQLLLSLLLLSGCSLAPVPISPTPPEATDAPVESVRQKIDQAVQQEADSLKSIDNTESTLLNGGN